MHLFTGLVNFVKEKFSRSPLITILLVALIIRMFAAFFARGYGMHDDHFLVIEASQSWVDGTDYNNWLPKNRGDREPDGHSFFYVGLHYLFFSFFKWIGINNPDIKMYLIRILHALFSLLVVWGGYKIAEKVSDRKTALQVGLFLALLWFMPFLAVRNLVEIAATPFLMIGLWMVYAKKSVSGIFLAGFIMGVAVSVRFQTVLFLGGTSLALLFLKEWKKAFVLGLGGIFSICLLQGMVDFFIWERPFAELKAYIVYNLENKTAYGVNNYMMYPSLIFGILIPPVSLFLIFGFFLEWKKNILIFLPSFIFFAFHEYFPNKQERFILTIIPFIVLLGIIGWNRFIKKSKFWSKRPGLMKGFLIFFWIVNILLLLPTSTSYTKKSRIEAMLYLYPEREQITSIVIDDNNRPGTSFVPLFYLGKWIDVYQLNKHITPRDSTDYVKCNTHQMKIKSIDFFEKHTDVVHPRHILFYDDANLDERVSNIRQVFPGITFETAIEPSNLDKLMHWLNPVNFNQIIYIYSNKKKN